MFTELLKQTACRSLRGLGINALAHYRHRHQVLVLNYHGVVSESHARDRFWYRNTVSADEFEQHLLVLRRRFHPVSILELREWLEGKRALPLHPVLVTLDDGYRNNLALAAPLLARHRVPAVVFLSTGYIGGTRMLWPEEVLHLVMRWPLSVIARPDRSGELVVPDSIGGRGRLADRIVSECKRIPAVLAMDYLEYLRRLARLDLTLADEELHAFLTWDEVRDLHRQGVDVGAHTVEHPILSRVTTEQLQRELRESKAAIEQQLGIECFSMAYPNGAPEDFSPTVVEAVRAAGYALAFTVVNDFHDASGDPLAFSRMAVPGHVDHAVFEAHVCGTRGALRTALTRTRGAFGEV